MFDMEFKGTEAIVFDLDGTLIHSKIDFPKMKREIVKIFRSTGVPRGAFPPRGTTFEIIREGIRVLKDREASKDISKVLTLITQTMNAIELERVEETVPIRGVRRALQRLRGMGLKIGVLTRGCREYATRSLKVAGLDDLVDEVVGRDEVSNPKPDPDQLFLLAQRLGVRPEQMVLVGDHLMDVECARNASTGFIGVLTGSADLETFKTADVERVLATVADLPDLL